MEILKIHMEQLIKKLNEAATNYYNGSEIMDNKEYDALYDELKGLEDESGIILPDSPTQKVGAEVVDSLPKVVHEYPALSLDKTKDVSEFPKKFGGRKDKSIVMWKMDGCTLVATYDNGKLTQLATRGNGIVGSVITHNAPYIRGLPLVIPCKNHLVVRGEAVMSYSEFERINALLPAEEKYKNPRNLCNASVQLYDSNELKNREIWFHAFKLVNHKNIPELKENNLTMMQQHFQWLKSNGFNVVEYAVADPDADPLCDYNALENELVRFTARADKYLFPVDGLVVAANDVLYAESLPGTNHNPNVLVGYALKWKDETVETTLRAIEWSASRTGLLNPVAVFDPVELCGTTVSRASLHNVSYIKEKRLRINDRITVYKANMIIPQVDGNLTAGEKLTYAESHPDICPCCGAETQSRISEDGNSEVAVCANPECPAKMVGKFVHFAGRECMNIEGISDSTIEKFVDLGFIREYSDFWHLDRYKEKIISMDGFGVKSYENMIAAAEKSRNVDFVSFLHALGVPNVGKGQAKELFKYLKTNHYKLFGEDAEKGVSEYTFQSFWHDFVSLVENGYDFQACAGIGEVIDGSIKEYFANCNRKELEKLITELHFTDPEPQANRTEKALPFAGKIFVITGSLNHFKNREECQELIERLGGKTAGSVSAKTSYLINNDVNSTSGKNKKAKDLGIPIISEEEFLSMLTNDN